MEAHPYCRQRTWDIQGLNGLNQGSSATPKTANAGLPVEEKPAFICLQQRFLGGPEIGGKGENLADSLHQQVGEEAHQHSRGCT